MKRAGRRGKTTFATIVRLVGIRRAVHGPKPWLYLSLAAWALRIVARIAARKPVVVRESLRPGQRIVVTHFKRHQV
jgi:hypothetical protein